MKINLKFKISNSKFREGFTLVELIVAASLFITVVFIASGSFIQALRAQRTVVSFTALNSNVSQAMEQMAREVRTGSDFQNSTENQLNFTNSRNFRVAYKLSSDGAIGRCEGLFCLQADPDFTPITNPDVKINSLKFFYGGIGEPDNLPPRITISISTEGAQNTIVNFQTSVSSYELGS